VVVEGTLIVQRGETYCWVNLLLFGGRKKKASSSKKTKKSKVRKKGKNQDRPLLTNLGREKTLIGVKKKSWGVAIKPFPIGVLERVVIGVGQKVAS